MGMNDQVREHFKTNAGVRFDNASLCKALDAEPQQISVALNVMHNNGEIKREKKVGHGYDYWYGTASAPKLMAPGAVASKLLEERTASTVPAPPVKTPTPAKPKKVKVKKEKKAHKSLGAIPLVEAAGIAPKADAPKAPIDSKVMFAIRNDGELGIDNDGQQVSLRRVDVQRLKEFMQTVAPLWLQ